MKRRWRSGQIVPIVGRQARKMVPARKSMAEAREEHLASEEEKAAARAGRSG